MSATVSPILLAAALTDARTQLAAAQDVDIDNHIAVIASQSSLKATLRRILWTLGVDDEPDVATQVDAEDGVTRPAYVRYHRDEVAA